MAVFSCFFELASGITERIQALKNAPPVLWGGIHPTIKPEQSAKVADIVCRSEAEDTIIKLVEKLKAGQDYSDLGNLCMYTKDDVLIKNEIEPPKSTP